MKLIAFLHPDLDLNANTINTLADLEASYKPFQTMRENLKNEVSRIIDDLVETEVRGGGKLGSGRIHKDLIRSMQGDVSNSVRHLTEKVLYTLTTSRPLQAPRHNLGGLAASPSMDLVYNMERQFSLFNRSSRGTAVASRSTPSETGGELS